MFTDEQIIDLLVRFEEGQTPIGATRATKLPVNDVIAAWRQWKVGALAVPEPDVAEEEEVPTLADDAFELPAEPTDEEPVPMTEAEEMAKLEADIAALDAEDEAEEEEEEED